MLADPEIIQFNLRVRSRSQAIREAAELLRNEMKVRTDTNPVIRYVPHLNYYHLEDKNLVLRYEIVQSPLQVRPSDSRAVLTSS